MDKSNKHCVHCGDEFEPDSRVKDQRYCKKEECQKARRALWQKERLRDDPDYKDNQKRCWRKWYSGHPGYYREYREKNTKYTEVNHLRQKLRDMKRRKNGLDKLLAKMDSIDKRICGLLGITSAELMSARFILEKKEFIAYRKPYYQVLKMPRGG